MLAAAPAAYSAEESEHPGGPRRRPVPPPRRVLPITFAEQHGSNAIPAKYSMEPHPVAVSRKVAEALRIPGSAAAAAAAAEDFPDYDYQVASSLRSSQSGRSSVSSVPSTTVSYMTKETTARGLFRKRKTVIDCGIINKFDNG